MTLHEMENTESTFFERGQEYLDVRAQEVYLDVRQMLDLEVTGWLDGKTLSCNVGILGENQTLTEKALSTNVTLFVKGMFSDRSFFIHQINIIKNFLCSAPPVDSSEGEIHPEGKFVVGEEGVLIIHFRSNPEPIELTW